MSINIQQINNFIESQQAAITIGGYISTSAAIGAITCVVFSNPIGAAGGAIFGASLFIGSIITYNIADTAFGLSNLHFHLTTEAILIIVSVATIFFSGLGASMLALTCAGFPITFKATVILLASNLLMAIPVGMAIEFGFVAIGGGFLAIGYGCCMLGEAVVKHIKVAQAQAAAHAAQAAAQEILGGAPVAI